MEQHFLHDTTGNIRSILMQFVMKTAEKLGKTVSHWKTERRDQNLAVGHRYFARRHVEFSFLI